MASLSSQAVAKRSSDTQLMPPPPPAKRIKRPPVALDEDDYTDALSHIIARDFFPGLLETQAQQDYLDALESKDKEWISTAGRRMAQIMTPGSQRRYAGTSMTPQRTRAPSVSNMDTPHRTPAMDKNTPRGWKGDTPMSCAIPGSMASVATSSAGRGVSSKIRNMGLGAFQQKYTSEDNESFNKLLDKQNEKKREKHAWLWSGNKIPSARELVHKKREAKRLEAQAAPDGSKEKQLMKLSDSMSTADDRPARPDGWKSKPENSLMFVPSSVEDDMETVQQKQESTSRMGEKQVLYHNTRIRPQVENSDGEQYSTVPPSPSLSAVRDAIAGRPRPTDSEPGFTGGETPRVNGYAFVDEDEPDPQPHSAPQTDENEEAYHLKLLESQVSDSTPNPFKLKESGKREQLLHRMVDRVAKNNRREKAIKETKTPVPMFPSSPMIAFGKSGDRSSISKTPAMSRAALTPAAQRLWAQVGNSTPKRAVMSSSTSGKNMWTPTPKRAK
ncbi:hypothetical protein TESG_00273 [Trichophyton tonsurans CBS 112818]|uniref:Nuclear protein Es2 n=2 Tax=Trichophyton TaxID=5550 RepID=F2Q4V0_TRIEC|nr:hypothetical protein TESG_00273 [Trichophyton tonsurans CBS 112818]EGE09168.1 hypothetical protein TEQG_08121 [Trichophyton equinum CBS 127.97]